MLRKGMFLADRYEILEQIGAGGMSDVYKAKCHKLNRYVAIKVMKAEYSEDKTFVTKFKAEAQSAAGLTHANIVNVYDVGEENGLYYIVMELVEGITLKKYIEKRGRIPFKETVSIAIQVANGMDAAHKAHIVHRDIKPQNIIISKDGKVKVTDFGIAKAATSSTINSSSTMGSVHYISPEQARGGYSDERSDIYSLGITIFEMLTGTVPFDGDSSVAVAVQHIQDEIPSPSSVAENIPISIDKIVLKCTQKKQDRRYQTAAALIADLKKALVMPDEDFVLMAPAYATAKAASSISQPEAVLADNNEDAKADKLDDNSNDSIPSDEETDDEELGFFDEDEEADDEEEYDDEYDDEDDVKDRRKLFKSSKDIEDDEEEEDYDDEDIDDEGNDKLDLIMKLIGIGIAVIILIITIFVIMKLVGSGKSANNNSSSNDVTEQVSTSKNSTTEADSADKVSVPSVVGKTKDEAIKALNDVGLGYKAVIQSSKTVAKDVVISQGTVAGTKVKKNTQIILTISGGMDTVMVNVPTDLAGKTEAEAKAVLEELKLQVAVEYPYSDTVEQGKVISATPTGSVAEGTTITINVSRGKEVKQVKMIKLKGLTEGDARKWCEDNGLVVNVSYNANEGTYGQVISANYGEGDVVNSGSTISIVVSSKQKQNQTQTSSSASTQAPSTVAPVQTQPTQPIQSEKYPVPDVKGKTQEAATSELEAAGFNVSVSLQNNATIAAGVVISYSPATTAARGETITINVSKGA